MLSAADGNGYSELSPSWFPDAIRDRPHEHRNGKRLHPVLLLALLIGSFAKSAKLGRGNPTTSSEHPIAERAGSRPADDTNMYKLPSVVVQYPHGEDICQ